MSYFSNPNTRAGTDYLPESATGYIGDRFERITTDLVNWENVKYIMAAGQRIARIDADGVRYLHKDHLGSTTVVTDETGNNYTEVAQHMPFGGVWGHALYSGRMARYKFTGQELDIETGLYDYGARLYDPVLGRFISPDSIIPDLYDPQSLNRYTYVRNNPLRYTDPNGQLFWDVVDIISFAHSAYTFAKDPTLGNLGWLTADAIGLCPGIPGATTLKAGVKGVGAMADIAKGGNKAENAVDVAKQADNVTDAAKASENATKSVTEMADELSDEIGKNSNTIPPAPRPFRKFS